MIRIKVLSLCEEVRCLTVLYYPGGEQSKRPVKAFQAKGYLRGASHEA